MANFQRKVIEVPPLQLAPATREAFEAVLAELRSGPRAKTPPIVDHPKHLFLRWLAEERNYLLHGSNRPDIEVFEPQDQTDALGRSVRAVFATADGLWPMYFAVVDRGRRHSLRNGFWRQPNGIRRYFFAMDRPGVVQARFVPGAVYVFAPEGFDPCLTPDGEPTEEWHCPTAVTPIARVGIEPEDFPFLSDVTAFEADDVFRVGDLLSHLVGSAAAVEWDDQGLGLVVSHQVLGLAREFIELLPCMELAQVTAALEVRCQKGQVRLCLRGSPALVRRLLEWAALPA